MNSIAPLLAALALLAGMVLPVMAQAVGVVSSPHNLSTGAEQRVCIFCHTPHHATRLADSLYTGPLWNRDEIADPFYYTPYVSSTLVATKGKAVMQPQGPSRICLSCHDGTIALASAAHGIDVNLPPLTGQAVLGRDLRRDHPVSVEYGAQPGEYADATSVTSGTRVKFFNSGGKKYVECTSCHDPHDNQYGNFLVVNTSVQQDALCSTCHTPNNWVGSSHQSGPALAAKGCVNCHVPHKAGQGENLLRLPGPGGIDANCTASCHNGTVGISIGSFTHGNGSDPDGNMHKGAENIAFDATWGAADLLPLKQPDKHVHCVDCHNPHQARPPAASPAPLDVAGVLKGVRGVDINGLPRIGAAPYAQYEYEVCFRCHSGDDAQAGHFNNPTPVVRIFNSWNERERFNWGSAKSWHPVAAQFTRVGNSLGLTLKDPNMRIIFCNDCHVPHGSAKPHMLRLDNQDTFSQTQNFAYPLCYSCHDENILIPTIPDTNVQRLHKAHVLGLHQSGNTYRASCSNCHDPHGVPNKPGLTTESNSLHLINFDTRYAGVGSSYDATAASCFVVAGTSLSCHPTTVGNAPFATYQSFLP